VRGSPIRTSSDQRSVGSSPRLNAASHVLHRLLVPRHPPCALNNLTTQKTPHNERPEGHLLCGPTNSATESEDARVHCAVLNERPDTTPDDPAGPAPPQGQRRYEIRAALNETAFPLPQDPTACLRPPQPTATRFLAAPRDCRTTGRRKPAAELVSVPPSSTTPAPRGPPERETVIGRAWLWTNRFPSGAELLARCSLERR
jgi:hypothetical protein